MLTLVFSKDTKISEVVTSNYRALYLDENLSVLDKTRSLLHLIATATPNDLTCIEEFIRQIREERELSSIFYELWNMMQLDQPTIRGQSI